MTALLKVALAWNRRVKLLLKIMLDVSLVVFSLIFAMLLMHGVTPSLFSAGNAIVLTGVSLVAVATFAERGLYRAVLRYITGSALRAIVPGVVTATLVLAIGMAGLNGQFSAPVLVLFALLLLFCMGGSRLFLRWLLRFPTSPGRLPAIIYGAGAAGQQLVGALHLTSDYMPVAFVDDDALLQGTTVSGVPVLAPRELRRLINQWKVREVLMAMPSLTRTRRRKIVSRLEAMGVEVKTIPSMSDVVRGDARFTDLRPVTPQDLLGRDPVPPQPELMQKTLTGKVVMVTGAGGSIGGELCRQIIAQNPKRLVLLDVSEYALYRITTELRDFLGSRADKPELVPVLGSVQNAGRMHGILSRYAVQTVFHAAAYKHVLLVEENVVEGIFNNVFGTKVIAEEAVRAGVENFILVSTDKTVRPANVMGASKRLAELICQAHARQSGGTVFSMVRFGNVLGSSGSVIPRFRDQIERGGPVTVTHPDVMRYFMTIPEAAQLVIQAGAMAKGGDVFVLDMGQPVKILDLARSMIRLHGLTPYLIDDSGRPLSEIGDIAIRITGLSKAEKLREELMIGKVADTTAHPRIMTASEVSLPFDRLAPLLDELLIACKGADLARIDLLLQAAPIDYVTGARRAVDVNLAIDERRSERHTPLRVVSGSV
jgi:FlaA1/EpsC-like NDP-sugar epimerase